MLFVTRIERDFRHWLVEGMRGAMKLERRLAKHPAEDAVKVQWRQRGTSRERLEIERAIEIGHDALDGVADGQLVERSRFGLHWQ
jgi:hypothetical protein